MQKPLVDLCVSTLNKPYLMRIRVGNKLNRALTKDKKSLSHCALKIVQNVNNYIPVYRSRGGDTLTTWTGKAMLGRVIVKWTRLLTTCL